MPAMRHRGFIAGSLSVEERIERLPEPARCSALVRSCVFAGPCWFLAYIGAETACCPGACPGSSPRQGRARIPSPTSRGGTASPRGWRHRRVRERISLRATAQEVEGSPLIRVAACAGGALPELANHQHILRHIGVCRAQHLLEVHQLAAVRRLGGLRGRPRSRMPPCCAWSSHPSGRFRRGRWPCRPRSAA